MRKRILWAVWMSGVGLAILIFYKNRFIINYQTNLKEQAYISRGGTDYNHQKTMVEKVTASRCQNLIYLPQDKIMLDQFIFKLKKYYSKTSYVPNVKNYEVIMPSQEVRRLQVVYSTDQQGVVNQIVKWYKLDLENLPIEITHSINAINPISRVISELLQESKVKWIRENGIIYIPETNAQIIVEVEDSKLTALEWEQGESLIVCKTNSGQLKCKCS
jgi:hypothetical protein